MENKIKLIAAVICIIVLTAVVTFAVTTIAIDITKNESYNDGYENYAKIRDLFTPAHNDTVTVERAGYHLDVKDPYQSGFKFWVNHTRELSSFYFDDQISYLVVICDGVEDGIYVIE